MFNLDEELRTKPLEEDASEERIRDLVARAQQAGHDGAMASFASATEQQLVQQVLEMLERNAGALYRDPDEAIRALRTLARASALCGAGDIMDALARATTKVLTPESKASLLAALQEGLTNAAG